MKIIIKIIKNYSVVHIYARIILNIDIKNHIFKYLFYIFFIIIFVFILLSPNTQKTALFGGFCIYL